MRYLKIFFLHLQRISTHRGKSFIWFLLALYNPLVLLLFWKGVVQAGTFATDITMSELTSYYLLLIIAGSTLMSHVEMDVADLDIRQGGIAKYLIRPLSYYWFKFFEEIHFRLLQGFYGLIVLTFISFYFGPFLSFSFDLLFIFQVAVIFVLGFFISFTFKMLMSFAAFWVTDIWGIYELVEVLILIFAGFILPLHLLPAPINNIAYILPFSYMIYFPVIALQGQLDTIQLWLVILSQAIWLGYFLILYRVVWNKGLRQFTGVGQ